MVKLPTGYRLEWSGAYEGMQRAGQRLMYVIPITLAIIAVLLYLNARSLAKVLIVLTAVPFSLLGAFLLLWLLGYHLSVAVWVGIIALAGVDAETGMVMLLYLDVSFEHWKRDGRMNSLQDLEGAVMEGAVQRVRPKMMTVLAILLGLFAHHVVERNWVRRHEAHRGADGGRHGHEFHPDASHLSSHLRAVEVVGRGAACGCGAAGARRSGSSLDAAKAMRQRMRRWRPRPRSDLAFG